jgi:serine/threonine protein kinase
LKIAIGIANAHNSGVIHGNLNMDNLVLIKNEPKIINWNSSILNYCALYNNEQELYNSNCRPIELYISETNIGTYNDVWAYGCILVHFYLGKYIFNKDSIESIIKVLGTNFKPYYNVKDAEMFEAFEYIKREGFPDKLKKIPHLVPLLEKIFTFDYINRISMFQILSDPFFKEFNINMKRIECSDILFSYENEIPYMHGLLDKRNELVDDIFEIIEEDYISFLSIYLMDQIITLTANITNEEVVMCIYFALLMLYSQEVNDENMKEIMDFFDVQFEFNILRNKIMSILNFNLVYTTPLDIINYFEKDDTLSKKAVNILKKLIKTELIEKYTTTDMGFVSLYLACKESNRIFSYESKIKHINFEKVEKILN